MIELWKLCQEIVKCAATCRTQHSVELHEPFDMVRTPTISAVEIEYEVGKNIQTIIRRAHELPGLRYPWKQASCILDI